MDNLNDQVTVVERPQSLKVLCILSFIMCGLMILFGLYGLKTAFAPSEAEIMMQQQQIDNIQQMNPDGAAAIAQSMEHRGTSAILGLVLQIVSLIGVIMMWNLKKTGFYLYVLGELLPYAVTIILSGLAGLTSMAGGLGETFQAVIWVVLFLVVAIDVLFIILYARNLKYMH